MTLCFTGGTFLSDSVGSLPPGFLPEMAGMVACPLSASHYRMFTGRLTPYVRALTCLRSLLPTGGPWISQESADCSRGGCP